MATAMAGPATPAPRRSATGTPGTNRSFLNGSLLLSGCVKRVLQKGTFSLNELLGQVKELVTQAG